MTLRDKSLAIVNIISHNHTYKVIARSGQELGRSGLDKNPLRSTSSRASRDPPVQEVDFCDLNVKISPESCRKVIYCDAKGKPVQDFNSASVGSILPEGADLGRTPPPRS